MFLWRPVMEELASALPISGAPYTYLSVPRSCRRRPCSPVTCRLNVSSKTLALIGASLLLLDFAATSVVSAATAISYLGGEVSLPFPVVVGSLIILIIFTLISLSGLRESARIALTLLSLHVSGNRTSVPNMAKCGLKGITMAVLFIASIIAWGKNGNAQIRQNWHDGRLNSPSHNTPREIFNGICIGVLGLTGFECALRPRASRAPF